MATAATVSYVDTIGTDIVTYLLTFGGAGSGSGTLTITNSANVSPVGGDIYVGDIIWHMDGGTPADLTLGTKPNSTWQVTDGSTNDLVDLIGGGGSLNQSARQDGFSGFFSSDVAFTPGAFTGLLCITCAPATYTFSFGYSGATVDGSIPMPLQIIYYNGTGNSPEFDTIRSVDFTATAVPEPELYAMLAAGLGFIGFVGARRRRMRAA